MVSSLTMNNEAKSKAAAKYIAGKHAHIQGPGYSAESQSAQLWVWATLVDALEEGIKAFTMNPLWLPTLMLRRFLMNYIKIGQCLRSTSASRKTGCLAIGQLLWNFSTRRNHLLCQ